MYRIVLSAILIIIAGVINYPLHAACLSEPGNPGTPTSCGEAASNSTSTQGNTSEVSSASSNPINAINGNKYQEEIDMPALPGEFGLELVRHYNSSLHAFGYTGYGWRLSYETDLFANEHTIQINQADGYRIIFTRDRKDPTICTPNDPARGTIVINKTAKGEEYIWIWANGRSLYFNHMGKLERITSASGQTMHFYRGLKGELIRVTDPQGRSMTFEYASKKSNGFRGIIAVNTPVGRYEYQHNDDKQSAGFGNLISVKYPQEKIGTHGQNEEERKIFNNVSHVERHYHYGEITEVAENKNSLPNEQQAAHFLTGITVNWQDAEGKAQNQRINTWAYNAQGRAMFSVLGPYDPTAKKVGPGQLTLRFSNPDQYTEKDTQKQDLSKPQTPHGHHQHEHKSLVNTTILIDGLGQQTIVKHTVIAGQYRLIEVTGVGCSSCPENNMQYRYDNLARLVDKIKLKPDGKPLYIIRKSFDKASRVKEISRIDYDNDKALPAQLLRRFEYPVLAQDKADFIQKAKGYEAAKLTQQTYAVYNQPNLIAMPSVVKGKEHQWRIIYNQYGQPTQITETGYRPALPTDKTKAPILISRTLSYQYKQIDGKNLLAQIDGPLPNGKTNTPQDSDITQYQYDKLGRYLSKITAPNNITTMLAYDLQGENAATGGTGRVIVSTLNDGARQIETKTVYSQNARSINQPVKITRSAWLLNAEGKVDADSHQATTVLEAAYNAQGKRTMHVGVDGNQQTMKYNDAGQAVQLLNNLGESLNWAYDTQGNPLAQIGVDTEGKVIDGRMWLRDEAGQLRAVLSPKGVEHVAVNMPKPQTGFKATASDSKKSLNSNQTTMVVAKGLARIKLQDDFGRTVYEHLPEDGTIITTFNVVNDAKLGSGETQTQTRISLDGKTKQVEKLHFSFAGQLLAREGFADGVAPCTDALEYEGNMLQSLTGCGASQTFTRNAFGQITTQTQTVYLAKQKMAGASFTQHFSYDNSGKLISRTMPTQQVLNYGYGEQQNGQTQSIQLQRAWLTRIAKLTSQSIANSIANTLPESWTHNTLINRVQQQPFNETITALQSVQHGNGIKTTWQPNKGATKNTVPLWVKVSAALNAQNSAGLQITKAKMAESNQAINIDSFGRLTLYTPSEGDNTGKPVTLQWNAANQLIAVLDTNTKKAIARYGYDSTGNRVSKTIYSSNLPQTTYYAYDNAHKVIAETDANNHIVRQYLYLDHRLHSMIEGNNTYAVSTDWRGLPQQVTDKHQRVVWQQRFDAWGNTINETVRAEQVEAQTQSTPSKLTLNIRLAGQYYDAETGLHYNIHRYFNPQTHQYISPDPLGTPNGNNRYAYLNGNPYAGVDPLGLFEVPFSTFNGIVSAKNEPDEGHGDLLRIAFAQYNATNGMRFSQTIIDQIIVNNYHSDANGGFCYFGGFITGGGQCQTTNHFDNPNDGSIYNLDGTKKSNYNNNPNSWIQKGIDQINNNRQLYDDVQIINNTTGGVMNFSSNISIILNAFGQNSHALADFYAHTNWVDATTRGGCYQVPISKNGQISYLAAAVPNGLAQTTLWNEDPNIKDLYSGTVETIAAVKTAQSQYHSHAYWNKDANELSEGEELASDVDKQNQADENRSFTKQEQLELANIKKLFFWENTVYDPKYPPKNPIPNTKGFLDNGIFGVDYYTDTGKPPKAGDRVYVRSLIENHHQLAYQLAIMHTLVEIQRLYDVTATIQFPLTTSTGQQTSMTLHDVFKLDTTSLNSNSVNYKKLYDKNVDGGIKP
jgi:RHS repeat-associated protein